MSAHRLKPSRCPECKKTLDAASGIDTDDSPTPGSVSVCHYCGTLLEFSPKLKLCRMKDDTLLDLDDSTRIMLLRVQRGILAYRRETRR